MGWLLATRRNNSDHWLTRPHKTVQQKLTSAKQTQDAVVIDFKFIPRALKKSNTRDGAWITIEIWQHVKNTRPVVYAIVYEHQQEGNTKTLVDD